MGKRIGKTLSVLAIVLLYQSVTTSSASASWYNDLWSTSLIIQKSVSPSEDQWKRATIKDNEPLSQITKEKEEEMFEIDLFEGRYDKPILTLNGQASFYHWYGCLGCNPERIMANGKVLDDDALTMAIGADKKEYVGSTARVTNLDSGRSVIVTITDTGGFYKDKYGNRVADLTIGTKNAIGMDGGLAQVKIEVFSR